MAESNGVNKDNLRMHDRVIPQNSGSSCSVGEMEQGFPLLNKSGNSVVCDSMNITAADKEKEAEGREYEREGTPEDGRETWGKKVDFLLSIIGFAVDLANVWRFPNLCYKNGGGAFLIPYFIMLAFGAVPLFYMELVLGQFHRQGAIGVWKISPIFKGVGMAECFIAYIVAFYYNVIIAWSVFYMISSFNLTLPWTRCGQWASDKCCDEFLDSNFSCISNLSSYAAADNSSVYTTMTAPVYNMIYNTSILSNATVITCDPCGIANSTTPVQEFFERRVQGLGQSTGIHNVGAPRWELVLCLFSVFIVLYFSLWKGVKSSGKVVWVTATMPYLILLILLIRGALLPGSLKGIEYFLKVDFAKLKTKQVWNEAAVQVFYSTGAGFGVHLAYASYNKFHNNCYRDCLATASINAFTSIFSGLVIFCYLGYMSERAGVNIKDVAQDGPGLTFVVYPEALATLPGPPVLSSIMAIIFFFMLITLGLDSAMGGLEAALTGLSDEITFIRKYKYHREVLTLCVVGSAFLFALQNVTNGGIFLFHIWDNMAAGTTLLFCVFFQAIAIGWFYGLDQFVLDIQNMLGFTPMWYWRICWKFISPVFLGVIIIFNIVDWVPLTYKTNTQGVYTYPWWGNVIAWLIVFSSMILIPGAAIYKLISTPGTFSQRIALCISPYWEHSSIKKGGRVKRFELKHWLSMGPPPTCSTRCGNKCGSSCCTNKVKGHAL